MTPDQHLDATFAALADPTRRAILARLASGEASVTELAQPFEMSMPAISKHLKVLERAGLIARGREAQWRPCSLKATPLKDAADFQKRMEGLFEQIEREAIKVGYRDKEIQDANYALVAFLDEAIQRSDDPNRGAWSPLQSKMYAQAVAGEGVFDRLKTIRTRLPMPTRSTSAFGASTPSGRTRLPITRSPSSFVGMPLWVSSSTSNTRYGVCALKAGWMA